jgi:uncharacterized protein
MSLIPTTCATVFHLAFPVGNLADTRAFYVEGLGAVPGRESGGALILNLYGSQLVAHVVREIDPPQRGIYPRHFGVVFKSMEDWQGLCDRAQERDLSFYQQARVRFEGEALEHWTFFLSDPFGNLLEFKHYANQEAVFGMVGVGKIGDAG